MAGEGLHGLWPAAAVGLLAGGVSSAMLLARIHRVAGAPYAKAAMAARVGCLGRGLVLLAALYAGERMAGDAGALAVAAGFFVTVGASAALVGVRLSRRPGGGGIRGRHER